MRLPSKNMLLVAVFICKFFFKGLLELTSLRALGTLSDLMLSDSWSRLCFLLKSGGFVMYPLLAASFLLGMIILERAWSYRSLGRHLRAFHLECLNAILKKEFESVRTLCRAHPDLPSAELVSLALERRFSQDPRLQSSWVRALERKRRMINGDLRKSLWILGTIGSAAPLVGLFGTVVGILGSFQEMARLNSGGFSVVAAGISESLIATASGIIVAIVALLSFNTLQTRCTQLILIMGLQMEELVDVLSEFSEGSECGSKF
jgi:biopolymer transport protein ExbB